LRQFPLFCRYLFGHKCFVIVFFFFYLTTCHRTSGAQKTFLKVFFTKVIFLFSRYSVLTSRPFLKCFSFIVIRYSMHCKENPIPEMFLLYSSSFIYALQRKSDPQKETARPQSQFPHSWICVRFTVNLFSYSRIGRPIMGIYKSLTET
jgi:hypothetical protein